MVFLSPFSPEERNQIRCDDNKGIINYLHNTRGIECNSLWYPPLSGFSTGKSIFTKVLKDLGFKEKLLPNKLPCVLTQNDLSETLFSVLMAPSLPVVCDSTGQFEHYFKNSFIGDFGYENISGADIFASEKILSILKSTRAALINDLNC